MPPAPLTPTLRWNVLTTLAAALTISACGGGGGATAAPAPATTPGTPDPPHPPPSPIAACPRPLTRAALVGDAPGRALGSA